MREAVRNYWGPFEINYISDISQEGLLEKVARLPESSAILYLAQQSGSFFRHAGPCLRRDRLRPASRHSPSERTGFRIKSGMTGVGAKNTSTPDSVFTRDAQGTTLMPREMLSAISEKANAPVFGILESYFGAAAAGSNRRHSPAR